MIPVLLTGAAGGVGRHLRRELAGRYDLRLSDLRAPDDLGDTPFIAADLADPEAVRRAVAGVDAIIHVGGYSVEADWQTILDANIVGTHTLYESARREGVRRIVYASSNHAVGFYQRAETINHRVLPRPDSR